MKIKSIGNTDEFFDVVRRCRGRVELVTEDGDRLNLKSRLSQYVAIAKLFYGKGEGSIPEIEVVCYDPEDNLWFADYVYNGPLEQNPGEGTA